MTKPIISFIALLISIGFGFFYVKPEYNLVQERRANIVSLDAIIKNSSMIKTLIDQTTENLNSIDITGMARFSVFLPEKIDMIRFANNIQHIGLASGLILEGINVGDPSAPSDEKKGHATGGNALAGVANTFSIVGKDAQGASALTQAAGQGVSMEKKYSTTKATFTFVATYEGFQLLLNNLEKSLGLINITSLTFSPVSGASDSKNEKSAAPPTYQYSVSIETYSLK